MVKLDKIYTRGGDKGMTSLGNGQRVQKHDPRVTAYGTVDECNAILGLARQHVGVDFDAMLGRIQNDLFDLGADLSTPEQENPAYPPLRIVQAQIDRLEQEIDHMNADLAPLKSFILPGGSAAAAWLHLARTVARRAERDIAAAIEALEQQGQAISLLPMQYMNRLSDHLFVLGRVVNDKGARDVLWVPGANR